MKNDKHITESSEFGLRGAAVSKYNIVYGLVALVAVATIGISYSQFYDAEKDNPAVSQSSEEPLKLYTFDEYMPDELVDEFEQKYNAKVEVSTFASSESLLNQSRSELGNYDVITVTEYGMQELIDGQILQELDFDQIKNFENIGQPYQRPYYDPGEMVLEGERAVLKKKYSVPYLWGTTGILYDTAQIDEKIDSWEDLWNVPNLKLLVLNDPREMIGFTAYAAGLNPLKMRLDKKTSQIILDKLMALIPSTTAVSSGELVRYMLDDTVNAGFYYSGEATAAIIKRPSLKYVLPAEGASVWFDNLVITKASKNQELAYKFLNFILDKRIGAKLIKAYPYSTTNHAALLYAKQNDPEFYNQYITNSASAPTGSFLLSAKIIPRLDLIQVKYLNQIWDEFIANVPNEIVDE